MAGSGNRGGAGTVRVAEHRVGGTATRPSDYIWALVRISISWLVSVYLTVGAPIRIGGAIASGIGVAGAPEQQIALADVAGTPGPAAGRPGSKPTAL
ncbi:hypothetical protein [Microbispora sp. NPDC049125]|uniref:hypothetical protein n=1 Tax=Microbispora sp. NPDC049125 TaxID=3154929 RepID=UPI00346562BC